MNFFVTTGDIMGIIGLFVFIIVIAYYVIKDAKKDSSND